MAGPLDYVAGSSPGVAMDPYLMVGLGILGSASKPETLGPNIMQSLAMANQARQGQAQNLLAQQKLAQAGQWENFVATLPPGDQELMRAMGPTAGASYLTEQMKAQEKRAGGAWQGTGFQAQAANTYNRLMGKLEAGETLTPEEQRNMSMAYQTLTAPQTVTTPEGVYQRPGMALPAPIGMAGAPGVMGPGPSAGPGTPGVPGFTPKSATESERKAAALYGRMRSSNAALSDLEAREDFDPSAFSARTIKDYIGGRMKESASPVTSLIGAAITSDEYNLYTSAAGDFIASLLRYDSGAAVPDTEFYRYYGTYFPLSGEGREVMLAKARRRAEAERSLAQSAGRALSDEERRKLADEVSKKVKKDIPLPQTPTAPASAAPAAIPPPEEEEVMVNF